MALPNNILQQVQTYQRSGLAFLLNSNCFIGAVCNTKFENFENFEYNLGSTVTFDLPPRFQVSQGLVWQQQQAVQRVATLSATQSANVSFSLTAQDRIFNIEKPGENYLPTFAQAAIHTLATSIEQDIARNIVSGTIIQGSNTPNVASGPYRFFGDGVTPINSFGQLAQMIANFKNSGMVHNGIKVILPDVIIPSIVNSGLNQFVLDRNNDMAMSWEVGAFGTPKTMYYQSNLLPIHTAGNVGKNAQVLTLVSTNDPTGQNVTQLTFSGATANDANAILQGDMFQFNFGVSGVPNVYYNIFIGSGASAQPVQNVVTANAGANGSGQVTVNLQNPLIWSSGAPFPPNLSTPLVPGMKVSFLPDHRAGLVLGGDAFYLALPRLPDQRPFDSYSEYDPDTHASIRFATGSILGQNVTSSGYDAVWGSMLVPEYCMRIAFPVDQSA